MGEGSHTATMPLRLNANGLLGTLWRVLLIACILIGVGIAYADVRGRATRNTERIVQIHDQRSEIARRLRFIERNQVRIMTHMGIKNNEPRKEQP